MDDAGGDCRPLLSPTHASSAADDRGSGRSKRAASGRSTGDVGTSSSADVHDPIGVDSGGIGAQGNSDPSALGISGIGRIITVSIGAIVDTGLSAISKRVRARGGREIGRDEDFSAGEHQSDFVGGPSVDGIERAIRDTPQLSCLVSTAVAIVIATGLALTARSITVHEGDDSAARRVCGAGRGRGAASGVDVNATAVQVSVVVEVAAGEED